MLTDTQPISEKSKGEFRNRKIARIRNTAFWEKVKRLAGHHGRCRGIITRSFVNSGNVSHLAHSRHLLTGVG